MKIGSGIVGAMLPALRLFLRRVVPSRLNRPVRKLDGVGRPTYTAMRGNSTVDERPRSDGTVGNASECIENAHQRSKRMHRLYRILSKANEQIIRLPDQAQAFEGICDVIVRFGNLPLAWIGELDMDGSNVSRVAASGRIEYLDDFDHAVQPGSRDPSPVNEALRAGNHVIVNDIDDAGILLRQAEVARRHGFGSVGFFPLRRHGQVVAFLAVYSHERHHFLDDDVALLNELADDVSFALDNHARSRALSDSEAQFRALFEHAPLAVALLDDQTCVLTSNPAFHRMLGADQAASYGRPLHAFIHPEDAGTAHEHFENLKRGVIAQYELDSRYICAREATIWGHTTVSSVRNEAGEFTHAVAMVEDVTERKRAEKELRIAAAAFDVQEGIVVTDSNNVIERVNHAFSRITGYAPEEVIGKTPSVMQSGRHDREFYDHMWERIIATGYWEGEVWNRRKNGEIYPEWLTISMVRDDNGQPSHYVGTFVDITEDKEAEKKIHQLAFYDPLTELANRRLLIDRLGRALALSSRNNTFSALLMLDFDHFKILNDTRGHAAGDALLIEAARRLKAGVRESDSVARMGGDEFVVILEGLDAREDTAAGEAVRRAHQLQSALSRPYNLPEIPDYRIGVSVGIALFKGHDQLVDDLLKQADVAMYEAKSDGRNALRFFNPERQKAIEVRADIERRLRRAIQDDEFELYYQPQIDREGRITGAEALLRWFPPDGDPVSPGEFIPVAEESGQILAISNWVLDKATAQLAGWQSRDLTDQLTLSVNISAKHFDQAEFVDEVRGYLEISGADPSRLYLELTESVGIGPIERVVRQFNALRDLRVRFSIDDFGTGYSSLSYLQRLPVDQIKIDRAFINGLPDDENTVPVVRAILAMSHAFHLNVVAEGVETPQQHEFLLQADCDAFQGFHFCRPVPAAEFESMLLEWTARKRPALPA